MLDGQFDKLILVAAGHVDLATARAGAYGLIKLSVQIPIDEAGCPGLSELDLAAVQLSQVWRQHSLSYLLLYVVGVR